MSKVPETLQSIIIKIGPLKEYDEVFTTTIQKLAQTLA